MFTVKYSEAAIIFALLRLYFCQEQNCHNIYYRLWGLTKSRVNKARSNHAALYFPKKCVLPENKFDDIAVSEARTAQAALSNSQIAKSLDDAADAMEAEARRLRRRADELRRAEARAKSWDRARGRIRAAAIIATREGLPFGFAAHEIAAELGAPVEAVIQIMEQEARKTARERLALRNEEIMRLKRRGFTNSQISARMGLHEKSVARIGGRMRRYMVFRGPDLP